MVNKEPKSIINKTKKKLREKKDQIIGLCLEMKKKVIRKRSLKRCYKMKSR